MVPRERRLYSITAKNVDPGDSPNSWFTNILIVAKALDTRWHVLALIGSIALFVFEQGA